jgi:hypothetical protein
VGDVGLQLLDRRDLEGFLFHAFGDRSAGFRAAAREVFDATGGTFVDGDIVFTFAGAGGGDSGFATVAAVYRDLLGGDTSGEEELRTLGALNRHTNELVLALGAGHCGKGCCGCAEAGLSFLDLSTDFGRGSDAVVSDCLAQGARLANDCQGGERGDCESEG